MTEPMLPELLTPRLHLTPATPGDLDVLLALWRDPDVRRFLFDDQPVPTEQATAILQDCLALAADGLGLWMVRRRDDEAVAGCVALLPVTTAAAYEPRLSGLVEPLVALAPASWHHGYATEALTAVLRYAFDTRRLPQLGAAVDVPNDASHRLLARLGFQVLGECDGPLYRLRTYTLGPPPA